MIPALGRTGLLTLLVAACGSGATTGTWQGPDVHLVDGAWIGTEHSCGDAADDLECRTVVDRGRAALPLDVRDQVTKAVRADLPTTFVTSSGETWLVRLSVGIETRAAIVVDLAGGTRRVIGLHCYLPSTSAGAFADAMATCAVAPIDDWLDGHAPPTFPPLTTGG